MNSSVVIVVGFNLLIAGAILWLLPTLAGLTGIFRGTAASFHDWRQAAATALQPLPAALRGTATSLQQGRRGWNRSQKRLALIRTLWRAWPFLRGRWPQP